MPTNQPPPMLRLQLRHDGHLILYRLIHLYSSRRATTCGEIPRGPRPNAEPDQKVWTGMFGAPLAALVFCSVCFDRRPEVGCRAECSATADGLWMSSSQSLTTLEMRGFHSLLAIWAILAAVFRRWFADGGRASRLGRAETWAGSELWAGRRKPGQMLRWCEAVFRVGQPFGAGGAARATRSLRTKVDTGDRAGSGEVPCWTASRCRFQDRFLRQA